VIVIENLFVSMASLELILLLLLQFLRLADGVVYNAKENKNGNKLPNVDKPGRTHECSIPIMK
jgi:hypothetical protein